MNRLLTTAIACALLGCLSVPPAFGQASGELSPELQAKLDAFLAGLEARTPEQRARDAEVRERYADAIAIDALVPNTPEGYVGGSIADWEKMFDGAEVTDGLEQLASFEEVLEACRAARASTTLELIDTMVESDLDRQSLNVPVGAEELFETFRNCLQYSADHWFMHRGQLANARLAAGVDRMWF